VRSVHAQGEAHPRVAAGNDMAVALEGAINNDSPVADARTVVEMITLQGLKMTALGLAIGTVLLVPLMTLISNVLRGFALEPVRPATLVSVGFVLLAVSTVAHVVPATRAATVDPVSVLRSD
jgi:ABC-type antimicrobial peptide transport system permease subunit